MQRPRRSQSPYRVGSGPAGPPISFGCGCGAAWTGTVAGSLCGGGVRIVRFIVIFFVLTAES